MATKLELHKMKRKRPDGRTRHVWMIRWYGTDGKRYGETIGEVGKLSKRDAESMLRKRQGDFDHGEVPIDKPETITLAAFEQFHSEIVRGELSPASLQQCQQAFKWAVKVIGGETKIATINALHVAKIRNAMADAKSEAPTVHKTLAYLRAAFNRAIAHKLLVKGGNPFAGFKAIDGSTRAKEAVIRTRDEIRTLKAKAPDAWWKAAIGLWFCGLRLEEALSLKWSDVDHAAGTVSIRKCAAGSFKIGETEFPVLAWKAKTSRSYRTVPVPADTMLALKELQDKSDGSLYVFLSLERLQAIQTLQEAGKWRADSPLVNNVLRDWKRLQKRVLGDDVKRATIHDCRKTFATHASDLIPIQTLAEIVGDTPAVLMRYYTRPRDEHADKLRQAFDDGPALKLAS